MGITSISIIMTVVVLNFHYVSPVNKKELPEWLRRIIKSRMILDQHYVCNEEDVLETNLDIEDMIRDEIELKETSIAHSMEYENDFMPWNNVNQKVPIITTPTTIPPPVAFQPNNISSSSTMTTSRSNLLSRHNKVYPPNKDMKKMKKESQQYFGNSSQASYGQNEMCATTTSNTTFNDNETNNTGFKVGSHKKEKTGKYLIIENILRNTT